MRFKVNIKLFESWLVLESTRSDWLAARDCERHSKAAILIVRDLAIFDVNSIKEEVNLKRGTNLFALFTPPKVDYTIIGRLKANSGQKCCFLFANL